MGEFPKMVARVAVLLISLGLVCLAGVQAFAVYVEGTRLNDPGVYNSGLIGLLIIPFYLISGIFAWARPFVSAKVLCIAGVLSLIIAFSTGFKSLVLWASISLAAALLSFLGGRQKKRVKLRVIPGGKAKSTLKTRASVI